MTVSLLKHILIPGHIIHPNCGYILDCIFLKEEYHARVQLVIRHLVIRDVVHFLALTITLRPIFLDEEDLFLGLVYDTGDGVALFKRKGLDHIIEVLAGMGPDATVGADHVAAVARVLVLKSITLFLHHFLVTHSKRYPLRGVWFDAVLENSNLRIDIGLHQGYLVLLVLLADDLIR
jgi:hypothetical protein